MRRILLLTAALAIVAIPAAFAKAAFPETIALPNGWQPEGIAIGNGTTFYVGSIPTGAIYRGDLRTGQGAPLVQGATGRAAIGVDFDRGRLFVAGGSTGKGFVYDARTGALVREIQLATGGGATFVNDVVATKRAAWFTDSNRARALSPPALEERRPRDERAGRPADRRLPARARLQPERHRRDGGREDDRRPSRARPGSCSASLRAV